MVIHNARDMNRSRAFCRDTLGMAETDTPGCGSPGWNTFGCDGVIVALRILTARELPEHTMPRAGLNLEVDGLDAAVAGLWAGGGKLRGVHEAGGGIPVRVAEVADTDCDDFELSQPVR